MVVLAESAAAAAPTAGKPKRILRVCCWPFDAVAFMVAAAGAAAAEAGGAGAVHKQQRHEGLLHRSLACLVDYDVRRRGQAHDEEVPAARAGGDDDVHVLHLHTSTSTGHEHESSCCIVYWLVVLTLMYTRPLDFIRVRYLQRSVSLSEV